MWEDIFNSIFSGQDGNRSSSSKGSFGNSPVPPEISDWVRQLMVSPFTQGKGEASQAGGENNLGQLQGVFSQWPFSTLKNNPFEGFLQGPSTSDENKGSRPGSRPPSGKSGPFGR